MNRGAAFILIGIFCGAVLAGQGMTHSPNEDPQPPRYELTLDFQEFSVLHSAIRSAIDHFGGAIQFEVRLVKETESDPVEWQVAFRGTDTIASVSSFMSEMTTEVVRAIDFENLSPDNATAMSVIQSINNKIASARANPIWDPVTLSGRLKEDGDNYFLKADEGDYRLSGDTSRWLEFVGKPVVATGIYRVKGEFEPVDVVEE